MFETFEHTADLGLRIRAEDLPGLFAEAGRALFSVVLANLDQVRAVQEKQFIVKGRTDDYLLFDWLRELLYTFETDRIALREFDVELADFGLRATCRGEPIDARRHELGHEVKAVTYHGLKMERTPDGWLAEVIVDI